MNVTSETQAADAAILPLTDGELARIAKALGHPARVAIVRFLAEKRTCYCGEIVRELPLAQSTVSQHLRELKQAGLIQGAIDGKRVCYCLDAALLRRCEAGFGRLLAELSKGAVVPGRCDTAASTCCD